MRKLILEAWLSLDGFAENRDAKLDLLPATGTDHCSDRDQVAFPGKPLNIGGRPACGGAGRRGASARGR